MKPVFAVQVTNRDDEDLHQTVRAITGAGYEWINFGVVPFEDSVTNVEEFPADRPVIVLGGTLALRLYQENKLPPNWYMFYSYWYWLFDQHSTQLSPLKTYMVNEDPEFYTFDDVRDRVFKHDVFIKPSSDMKAFAGTVVPKGTTLEDHLKTVNHALIKPHEIIMVASPIQLGYEYRVFIVNNKIVDCSQYRSPRGVEHRAVGVDTAVKLSEFFDEVKSYIESTPLTGTYCMDVAETKNGYRIVEFNCFNCCGMYKVDRVLVLSELGTVVEATKWD